MEAKLISCSANMPELSNMGMSPRRPNLKAMIAKIARVSNPSNEDNPDSDKLIQYLIDHRHWSPFEMASCCLEIITTRDIGRQMLRHRSFNFQEFSQRYANISELDDGFEIREARLQDKSNRQNSLPTANKDLQKEWEELQRAVIVEAKLAYKWAIRNGIAKEQARVVLPEGNTLTRMYVNGTIRSWIHYLEVRLEKGTQKEHRRLAAAILEAISEVFDLKEFV